MFARQTFDSAAISDEQSLPASIQRHDINVFGPGLYCDNCSESGDGSAVIAKLYVDSSIGEGSIVSVVSS